MKYVLFSFWVYCYNFFNFSSVPFIAFVAFWFFFLFALISVFYLSGFLQMSIFWDPVFWDHSGSSGNNPPMSQGSCEGGGVASLQPSNAETLRENSVHNDSLNCSIIFCRFSLARDCHLLLSSTHLPSSQTLVDISSPVLSSDDFVSVGLCLFGKCIWKKYYI